MAATTPQFRPGGIPYPPGVPVYVPVHVPYRPGFSPARNDIPLLPLHAHHAYVGHSWNATHQRPRNEPHATMSAKPPINQWAIDRAAAERQATANLPRGVTTLAEYSSHRPPVRENFGASATIGRVFVREHPSRLNNFQGLVQARLPNQPIIRANRGQTRPVPPRMSNAGYYAAV